MNSIRKTAERLAAKRGQDEGFTLIELLVVIVILGVLAAVVVFSVGGITDTSQAAACKADLKTLQVAQEAHYAKLKSYAADDAALVAAGLIASVSELYDTSLVAAKPVYTKVLAACP